MDDAATLSQTGLSAARRLAELHRHLVHLRTLRPRVTDIESLRSDLSFQNDVLFSLLAVCQSVLNIAGELSTRHGLRFEDYAESIGNLGSFSEVSDSLVSQMQFLPKLWDDLIHDPLFPDLNGVIDALDRLQPVEEFAGIVRRIEMGESPGA